MQLHGPAPRGACCADCGRAAGDGVHLALAALLAPERRVWLCAASQPCAQLTADRRRLDVEQAGRDLARFCPPKLPPASPWTHPLDRAEAVPAQGRRLCAHADQDGEGMHWLAAGGKCRAGRR